MIKEEISKILNRYEKLAPHKSQTEVTHSYTALKDLSLISEFEDEYAFLFNLLESRTDDFVSQFKERCRLRAIRNEGSALSFINNSNSLTNKLYWELTKYLFNPQTLADMFAVINPNIKNIVLVTVDDFFQQQKIETKKSRMYPNISITCCSIVQLKAPASELTDFNHYVSAGNILFDITQIQNFHLPMHLTLFNELKAYPELADVLYNHNHDLKQLSTEINAYNHEGFTLREVLADLVIGLQAGGNLITDTFYATPIAEKAHTRFLEYWNPLPTDTKVEYGSLKNEDDESLDDVIEHLQAGECVETASTMILGILNYPQNALVLNKRGSLSQEEKTKTEYYYKKRSRTNGLEVVNEIEHFALPKYWFKRIIPLLEIQFRGELILQLIHFPPALYSDLLTAPSYDFSDNEFLEEIAGILTRKVLNATQYCELINAIKKNYTRFDTVADLLLLAVVARNIELVTFALTLFQKHEEYCAEILKLRSESLSILHLASTDPTVFPLLLAAFPSNEHIQKAIETTDDFGNNILHTSCTNFECFEIIRSLYSDDEEFSQLVLRPNLSSETILHILIKEEQYKTFTTILNILRQAEQHSQLLFMQDLDGNTILHLAIEDTESLNSILNTLASDMERLELLKIKNHQGCTAISYTYEYPEALSVLLNTLGTDNAKLTALALPNEDGSNILFYAALYPNLLTHIMATLEGDNARIRILDSKIMDDTKLAYKAICSIESLESLLNTLETDAALGSLLKIKDNLGNSLLRSLDNVAHDIVKNKFSSEQQWRFYTTELQNVNHKITVLDQRELNVGLCNTINTKNASKTCQKSVNPTTISDPIETFIQNKIKNWSINSQKKAKKVIDELGLLKNRKDSIQSAALDPRSALYKALNTHRYGFFTISSKYNLISCKTRTILELEELVENLRSKR